MFPVFPNVFEWKPLNITSPFLVTPGQLYTSVIIIDKAASDTEANNVDTLVQVLDPGI